MATGKSGTFSDLRGKLDDVVFMGTRRGKITSRAYVVPTDPATTHQGYSRTAWANTSSAWSALSPAEHDAFLQFSIRNDVPVRRPYTDALLTGRDLYFRLFHSLEYLRLAGIVSTFSFPSIPPRFPLVQFPITSVYLNAPTSPGQLRVLATNPFPYRVVVAAVKSPIQPATVNRFYQAYDSSSWSTLSGSWIAGSTNDRVQGSWITTSGVVFTKLLAYAVDDTASPTLRYVLPIKAVYRLQRS